MKQALLILLLSFFFFSCEYEEYRKENTQVEIQKSTSGKIVEKIKIVESEVTKKIIQEEDDEIILDKKQVNKDKNSIINKNISKDINYGSKIKLSDNVYLENGEIYCIFGDENNKNPDVGILYSKEKLNVEDPYSFEKYTNYKYFKDKYNIYSFRSICTTGIPGSCSCNLEKLPFDVNTHKNISFIYDIDKNNVYYNNRKIKGIDVGSFEEINEDYIKDKNNVFYCDFMDDSCEVVNSIDVNTVEYVSSSKIKDKSYIYESGKKVGKVSPEGLIYLGNNYFKNKNYILYDDEIIEGVDYESFIVFSEMYYAKDKNNVYYEGNKISGLKNISGIKVIGSGHDSHYLKNKDNIYYFDTLMGYKANIVNADYNSFKYIVGSIGKDKDNKYVQGKIYKD